MSQHSAHDSHELGHIIPFHLYRNVFLSLLVLTVITVLISKVDLGVMNMVVAMMVASVKATIVALFFMHLKYENPLVWLYAIFPIVLLGLLIAGVFIDNPLRTNPEPVKVVAAAGK